MNSNLEIGGQFQKQDIPSAKLSQVQVALKHLEQAAAAITGKSNEITHAFDGVLAPSLPAPEGKTAMAPREAKCPLAESLDEISETLERASATLAIALQRNQL